MNGKLRATALALVTALGISGCANTGNPSNEDIGKLTGGVIGALIGSSFGGGNGQLLLGVAGATIGYLVGEKIGKQMDDNDQDHLRAATERGFETSNSLYREHWTGRNGNKWLIVITTENPHARNRQTCKRFHQRTTVVTGTRTETHDQRGTLCYDEHRHGWFVATEY